MRLCGLLLLLALTACGGPSGSENRRPGSAPQPRAYVPPADGRLTESQVAKYVAFLQNRERFAGSRAEPEGDARADPDSEAARSLGIHPDEIRWIGRVVLEARIRLEERESVKRNLETYRAALASLKKALAASTDPPTRTTLSRQIAELERELGEAERGLRRPSEKVLVSNEALVQRFRVGLDSARRALPGSR